MKSIKFLLGLLTVVLVMASCAATQGAYDDYADAPGSRQVGNRLYVQDPYYGTVVLERDPVTGRYYDVTYGSRLGTGYGYGYGYRAYPNSRYRTYPRSGGYYNGGTIQQGPSRQELNQHREETRNKVLGNKR